MKSLKGCILLFVILVSGVAIGQTGNGCYDSLQINYTGYCDPVFEPVCGCDGNTYRNECFATRFNGVVKYEGGICEAIAVDIRPNPVSTYLNLDIVLREIGDAYIFIVNIKGDKFFERRLKSVEREKFTLDVTNFDRGLYFIVAETRGEYAVERFAKFDY